MPSACVFLAGGTEEMELVICVDILRRAQIDVTIIGIDGVSKPTMCSRGIAIKGDISVDLGVQKAYDLVVVPGGLAGCKRLTQDPKVGTCLKTHERRGVLVAAICAGPIVLKHFGIAHGKKVTSHPDVKNELVDTYEYSENRVCIDGKLITSRGPGTCFEFALTLVEALKGEAAMQAVKGPMLAL